MVNVAVSIKQHIVLWIKNVKQYFGRRITRVAGDNRKKTFLYQQLYAMIQCYNAVDTPSAICPHSPWGRVLADTADRQFITFITEGKKI